MFIEFLLVRWKGFDPRRPLTERRRDLRRAIALRDLLGLPVTSTGDRARAREAHVKIDPIARELDQVERILARRRGRNAQGRDDEAAE